MDFATIAAIIGILLLLETVRSHGVLKKALKRNYKGSNLEKYPSVSVIRPIKGLDSGIRGNIHSALRIHYPGPLETIFVFDSNDEPAVKIVKEEIERCFADGINVNASITFCGEPPAGRTGKLNAMIAGFRFAKEELIAFADSDIRPDEQTLKRLVETLTQTPKAGSSFAPVIVSSRMETAGDVGYAVMINSLYSPVVELVANETGNVFPFIMGQFMLLKREAIAAIGGLEDATGQLVDDMYLGQRLVNAGYDNIIVPHRIPVIQDGLTLKGFISVFMRWIAFSRTGLPNLSFKIYSILRAVIFWLGLILSIYCFARGEFLVGIMNLFVPIASALSFNDLNDAIGGTKIPFKFSWISFALVVAAPLIYVTVFLKREVVWRGRSYRLDLASKLASSETDQSGGTITLEPAIAGYGGIEKRRLWRYVPPSEDRRVRLHTY